MSFGIAFFAGACRRLLCNPCVATEVRDLKSYDIFTKVLQVPKLQFRGFGTLS